MKVICRWSIGIDNFKWSPGATFWFFLFPTLIFRVDGDGKVKFIHDLSLLKLHNFPPDAALMTNSFSFSLLQIIRRAIKCLPEPHKSVMRFIFLPHNNTERVSGSGFHPRNSKPPQIQLNKHSGKLFSRQLFSFPSRWKSAIKI